MKTSNIFVAGVGVHVPESFPADDAVERGWYDEDERELYGWTGAAVAGDIPAPDLAIHAGRQALERSGHSAADIALHMHVSTYEQGPDGWAAHSYVLNHVGGHDVPSYRVWQACNGVFGSTELAASYLLAAPERAAALITGADNVGLPGFNRWNYGMSNGVLGDAGSALVLSRTRGFAELRSVATASLGEAEAYYRGAEPIFPPTADRNIRDRLASVGSDAAESLADLLRRMGDVRTELALRVLDEANVRPDQIARVCHQLTAQPRYAEQMLAPLGIETERGLRGYGHQYGHLTVNDQLVGMTHLIESGEVGPGDHLLVMSHGGGTALSCAVITMVERPGWSTRPAVTAGARP